MHPPRHRSLVSLVLLTGAAFAASTADAAVQVSNFAENPNAGTTISGSVWCATPFTTDADFYNFSSATLAFYNSGGLSGGPVNLAAALMTDNAGSPGTLLFDLTPAGPLAVDSFGDFTFAAAGILSPNTTYWIVVRTDGPFAYSLGTTSTAQTSPGGWTIGDGAVRRSFDSGVSWTAPGGWAQRFEIDASPAAITAMVTNLGEIPNSGTTINDSVWAATPFTTGANPATLTKVVLPVYNDSGLSGGNPVTFNARLLADNAGLPGSQVEDLGISDTVSAASFADVTFISSGSTLAANTTYWVMLRTTGPLAYTLATTSTAEASPDGWTIGDGAMRRSFDDGANWTGPTDVAQRMSVFAIPGAACVYDACDVDCNGTINPFDIQPFLDLLNGASPCSPCSGDADGNGTVNPFDVNDFLDCLS